MTFIDQEQHELQQEVQRIKSWWSSARFESVKRPYSAESIAFKRGTVTTTYRSNTQSQKLYTLLQNHKHHKTGSFGVPDLNQEIIHVSGTTDGPLDTVPNKVDHLFRMQLLQDCKQREERLNMTPFQRDRIKRVDFLKPIVAEANTTHGEITAMMKLAKMFVERGAAGICVKDQSPNTKIYKNLVGKVLIPTVEHINQLVAVRAQHDIMGVENLVISRTDAESARYITSNIDPRDHPFILGTTNPSLKPLAKILLEVESRGIQGSELYAIEQEWMEKADLKTYRTAVAEELVLNGHGDLADDFLNDTRFKSYEESKYIARSKYNIHVLWDWYLPCSREGLFCYGGCTEAAIARSIDCAEYADMLWIEVEKPVLEKAQKFARYVLAAFPQSLLCYNLSASYNWGTYVPTDISSFIDQIAKIGFVWQFITLRDSHRNFLVADAFTKACTVNAQRKDLKHDVDILNYQRWPSTSFAEEVLKPGTGSSSTISAISKI